MRCKTYIYVRMRDKDIYGARIAICQHKQWTESTDDAHLRTQRNHFLLRVI